MIKIESAIIEINEVDLLDILNAINYARKTIKFTEDPMGIGQADDYTYYHELSKRGKILISSACGGSKFLVNLELKEHTQERLGYAIDLILSENNKKPSCKDFEKDALYRAAWED